jgi:hypothetical protein
VRYAAVGGPNQVVSASASPSWVRSPTQATYPSGRINAAVGAVTAPGAGPLVEITSGDGWALIAWPSKVGLCLDFAVPDASPFSCGFPVRGAGALSPGMEAPVHAVAGFVSPSFLLGVSDGKATTFGVAAEDVAAVKVELSDGRLVGTQLFDAPPELVVAVNVFIVRLSLGALERTSGHDSWYGVRALRAYDGDGRLMERVEF